MILTQILDGIGLLSYHWGKAKIPNICIDKLFQSLEIKWKSLSGCFRKYIN